MSGESGDLVSQSLGGDNGDLFEDLLVRMEVEGHARVVALDDLTGRFLHGFGANAAHGAAGEIVCKRPESGEGVGRRGGGSRSAEFLREQKIRFWGLYISINGLGF